MGLRSCALKPPNDSHNYLMNLHTDRLCANSLITSPVTSYADQILSISRSRSSAGFSLDIPLIMLVASILK